jgi:hypothetical protein
MVSRSVRANPLHNGCRYAGETYMVDPPPHPEAGTPRWVKVAAIIALIVVVLVVIVVVVGGNHGPSRHTASDSGTAHSGQ